MKYIINADCYLVDNDGNISNLTNPTFDVNFGSSTDASLIKTEIKKRLVATFPYIKIKESLKNREDKEVAGAVSENSLYYELYVGKTGTEVIKDKTK